ncbi:TPA: hypothetical protein PXM28_002806 [Yersinia enterocolitica]|nr:hypothetical protein [Yersinia enterocolitica]
MTLNTRWAVVGWHWYKQQSSLARQFWPPMVNVAPQASDCACCLLMESPIDSAKSRIFVVTGASCAVNEMVTPTL